MIRCCASTAYSISPSERGRPDDVADSFRRWKTAGSRLLYTTASVRALAVTVK
jgi:hypothetical protein